MLVSAGLLHLIRPELFDPAIPFGPKITINYFAGVLEITLAIGLWLKTTRDRCSQITALWFLILIPVHLYVSFLEIPIFGVSEPILLWLRTGFQPVLFLWALSLQKSGWMISQRWSDVLFLHFEVDPKELQEKVPYPIDLFEGKAVVSIVPFQMGRIRFPFLPALPGLSHLLELNLRTYVRVDEKPMVYFFTLDANHFLGVFIARNFFRLPYRQRSMMLKKNTSYNFESESLRVKAKIENDSAVSKFDTWATERYALITKFAGRDLLGVVEHKTWILNRANILDLKDKFSSEFIRTKNFLGASYSHQLDVKFRPFRFH